MARRASVRYWPTRGTWVDSQGKSHKGGYCCTFKGKQHTLAAGPDDFPNGPTYLAALTKFRELWELDGAHQAKDQNCARVVLEMYLRDLQTRSVPQTLADHRRDCEAFCASGLADDPISRLTPFSVRNWVDTLRKPRKVRVGAKGERVSAAGDGRVAKILCTLKAAFNWGVGNGLIQTNPIAKIKLPPARSRSRECLVAPELHGRILATAHGWFRDLIICLEATGCRPGELRQATAADWRDDLGALVFYADDRRLEGESRHKTAGKGKDRFIYFAGESLAIMRELVRRHPTGALWRTCGRAMARDTISRRFERLADKLGVANLTAYSYRHTYATRWLEARGSIDDLAALLGNSAATIRKHYAHLLGNTTRLRELAERFQATGQAAEGTDSPNPATLPFRQAK